VKNSAALISFSQSVMIKFFQTPQ